MFVVANGDLIIYRGNKCNALLDLTFSRQFKEKRVGQKQDFRLTSFELSKEGKKM